MWPSGIPRQALLTFRWNVQFLRNKIHKNMHTFAKSLWMHMRQPAFHFENCAFCSQFAHPPKSVSMTGGDSTFTFSKTLTKVKFPLNACWKKNHSYAVPYEHVCIYTYVHTSTYTYIYFFKGKSTVKQCMYVGAWHVFLAFIFCLAFGNGLNATITPMPLVKTVDPSANMVKVGRRLSKEFRKTSYSKSVNFEHTCFQATSRKSLIFTDESFLSSESFLKQRKFSLIVKVFLNSESSLKHWKLF